MLNYHSLYPLSLLPWLCRQHPPAVTAAGTQSTTTVDQAHLAFHRACRHLAQEQPVWVARRFADLLVAMVLPALAANRPLPTAYALAHQWDRQFGLPAPYPQRLQQLAELEPIANRFLQRLQSEVNSAIAEKG